MSFGDHLDELRRRLLVCFIVVVVLFLVSFGCLGRWLFWVMEYPLAQAARRVAPPVPLESLKQSISPMEPFMTSMKVAFVFAIFAGSPVLAYELWAFVRPALRRREKRIVVPALFWGVGLFLAGASFAYFLVLPWSYVFLLTYAKSLGWTASYTMKSFIDFELAMLLAFGLVFELPLVLVVLATIGIVSPQGLSAARPYAVVGMFVLAAVVTPTTDALTMILLALPLCGLYEISVQVSKIFYHPRQAETEEPPKHT